MTIAELHAASAGHNWYWYIEPVDAYVFDGCGEGLKIINIAPCKNRADLYYVAHADGVVRIYHGDRVVTFPFGGEPDTVKEGA